MIKTKQDIGIILSGVAIIVAGHYIPNRRFKYIVMTIGVIAVIYGIYELCKSYLNKDTTQGTFYVKEGGKCILEDNSIGLVKNNECIKV